MCSTHRSGVGATVLGVFELTVIRVMIANFFPVKRGQFGEIDFSRLRLRGTAESITKKCLVQRGWQKKYVPRNKANGKNYDCRNYPENSPPRSHQRGQAHFLLWSRCTMCRGKPERWMRARRGMTSSLSSIDRAGPFPGHRVFPVAIDPTCQRKPARVLMGFTHNPQWEAGVGKCWFISQERLWVRFRIPPARRTSGCRH